MLSEGEAWDFIKNDALKKGTSVETVSKPIYLTILYLIKLLIWKGFTPYKLHFHVELATSTLEISFP